MLNKDEAEKKRRGYTDPKSFVRNDGSEVLHGEDWKARVEDLRLRSHGQCEQFIPKGWEGAQIVKLSEHAVVYAHPGYFERCGAEVADPHHIKPRSKGRDDRLENLQALCRYHHDLLDKRKPRWRSNAMGNRKS